MKAVRVTGAFKKDLKRVIRRGYSQGLMELIIDQLRSDLPLQASARPHPLKGAWKGYWDCHIEPDWVLIYQTTEAEVVLIRTGTHADLFGT
jgi:mRNA interferase YafQ